MPDPVTAPVTATTTIRAPAAVVYRALTDAWFLARWFPTRAKSNPRIGGTFSYVWVNKGRGGSDSQGGRYLTLVPGKLVAHTWRSSPGHTRVTWTLSGKGGRTRVAVTHAGWRRDAASQRQRTMVAGGWPFFVGNLKAFLERGADGRPRSGMKVERSQGGSGMYDLT